MSREAESVNVPTTSAGSGRSSSGSLPSAAAAVVPNTAARTVRRPHGCTTVIGATPLHEVVNIDASRLHSVISPLHVFSCCCASVLEASRSLMHGISVLGQAPCSPAQYLAAFVFDPKIPFVCHHPFCFACRFCYLFWIVIRGSAPLNVHMPFLRSWINSHLRIDSYLFSPFWELVSQLPTPTSFLC